MAIVIDFVGISNDRKILNEKGFVSGKGQPYKKKNINELISQHQLNTRQEHLRKRGCLL